MGRKKGMEEDIHCPAWKQGSVWKCSFKERATFKESELGIVL